MAGGRGGKRTLAAKRIAELCRQGVPIDDATARAIEEFGLLTDEDRAAVAELRAVDKELAAHEARLGITPPPAPNPVLVRDYEAWVNRRARTVGIRVKKRRKADPDGG